MNACPDDSVAARRAERQRDRILRAARHAFVEHGFHAAGMASIAAKAGMSPGLIYRYFDSKNAIVLAIVERELEHRQAALSQMGGLDEVPARMAEVLHQWRARDPDDPMGAVLFLETHAQAARDPELSRAIDQAELCSREAFRNWLMQASARAGRPLSQEQATERAMVLECLFIGMAARALTEPDETLPLLERALTGTARMLLS